MQYEGQTRIPSGCAISGIFSRSGEKFSGEDIIRSIAPMHDRSNGLGGGFAAYGIYPKQKDLYAFHVFYDSVRAKEECESIISSSFDLDVAEKIPTRKIPEITDEPAIWRYFGLPYRKQLEDTGLDEREFVARFVMKINTEVRGAYVFSSGKNMGVFKAVGFPEDVGASTAWKNTRATAGRRTAATRRTRRAGGAARIRLHCLITPSYITAKSPPTTQTAGSSRCSATTARC